jgi:hypothetical protein
MGPFLPACFPSQRAVSRKGRVDDARRSRRWPAGRRVLRAGRGIDPRWVLLVGVDVAKGPGRHRCQPAGEVVADGVGLVAEGGHRPGWRPAAWLRWGDLRRPWLPAHRPAGERLIGRLPVPARPSGGHRRQGNHPVRAAGHHRHPRPPDRPGGGRDGSAAARTQGAKLTSSAGGRGRRGRVVAFIGRTDRWADWSRGGGRPGWTRPVASRVQPRPAWDQPGRLSVGRRVILDLAAAVRQQPGPWPEPLRTPTSNQHHRPRSRWLHRQRRRADLAPTPRTCSRPRMWRVAARPRMPAISVRA